MIMVNESGGNRAGLDHARRPLSLGDVAAIAELPSIRLAAPSVSGQARLVHEGLNWATTVNGTTRDHFEIRQWRLAAGRYFTEEEGRNAGRRSWCSAVSSHANCSRRPIPLDRWCASSVRR